ncbi:MAG: undecaprenyl-phosphate glucose phosphotransferase [Lachnospiraceae bacterium]|nr:undecaprenyl-phosphate glucose phosphotransferase [Lachnospiraceae bacterium]
MIKDNQRILNRCHLLLDAMVVIFSYYASWYIRFESGWMDAEPGIPFRDEYLLALLFIVPLYLLLYYLFQLYTPKRVQGRRLEASRVIQANIIGLLIFILALYLIKLNDFSRKMMFIFFFICIFLEILYRNILCAVLRKYRSQGFNQKHIMLVGYSSAAEAYLDRVLTHPEWGYHILGILADNAPPGTDYRGVKVLAGTSGLSEVIGENNLDEIVITLGLAEYHKLIHVVSVCEKSGVHTKFVPDYNNVIPTKPYTEDLLGIPVIHIRHVPLSNPLYAFLKRCVDIAGSLVAIAVFSWLMVIVAILIRTTSPGPVIFKQERIGQHNRSFYMYKFRSMVEQTEQDEKNCWTTKDDPRVTKVGRFIRKTSVDELPQLFNVLKGEMSLVGPRPERPQFVEKFKEEIPRYMIKHQVRPGMTGWAQVNGYRGDTSIRKRIDCDLYYIENWTMGLDFKILFLTFFKGFVNKNAY